MNPITIPQTQDDAEIEQFVAMQLGINLAQLRMHIAVVNTYFAAKKVVETTTDSDLTMARTMARTLTIQPGLSLKQLRLCFAIVKMCIAVKKAAHAKMKVAHAKMKAAEARTDADLAEVAAAKLEEELEEEDAALAMVEMAKTKHCVSCSVLPPKKRANLT